MSRRTPDYDRHLTAGPPETITCPDCEGEAEWPGPGLEWERCRRCSGTGEVPISDPDEWAGDLDDDSPPWDGPGSVIDLLPRRHR